MIGVGQYIECIEDGENNYMLLRMYDSFIEYYKELTSGKIFGVVPYDIIVSPHIISCKMELEKKDYIIIASIKNKMYDTIQQG